MKTLSICIPVFNRSVTALVSQLLEMDDAFLQELLVFDDGSEEKTKEEHQQSLRELPKVLYKEMPENLGRSKIRNHLGEQAQGDFLLFLDDDCIPQNADFLRNYLEQTPQAQVLCGGHVYPAKANKEYALHHFIGTSSEVKSAAERNKHPYHSFHSSNFCVDRKMFLGVRFNEKLTQYGHEDTLFGYQLGQRESTVLHLNNPVVHLGLQSNAMFLAKTQKAIENLAYLYKHEDEGFANSVKLLRAYSKLKRLGGAFAFAKYYQVFGKQLHRKLLYDKPSIKRFNRFKMSYLCWLLR